MLCVSKICPSVVAFVEIAQVRAQVCQNLSHLRLNPTEMATELNSWLLHCPYYAHNLLPFATYIDISYQYYF